MGLNLHCNQKSQKCGSYSNVQRIRYLLLKGLKTYYKVRRPSDYDVLVYLEKLTKKENQVQYDIFDKKIHEKMRESQVDGFTTFIFHSDHDDVLYDFQVKSFLNTWKRTESFMSKDLKGDRHDFFLQEIFQESIDTGSTIVFT